MTSEISHAIIDNTFKREVLEVINFGFQRGELTESAIVTVKNDSPIIIKNDTPCVSRN